MKVRKTLIAAAVVALIPLGASAIAGGNDYGDKDKAGAGASFKQLDANKDGRVSQAEAAVDSTVVRTGAIPLKTSIAALTTGSPRSSKKASTNRKNFNNRCTALPSAIQDRS